VDQFIDNACASIICTGFIVNPVYTTGSQKKSQKDQ
jgi:hypothetical protein